ncbi:MAG: S8 family peptidase, partial [Opitutaceae bacterium]|nr:S8 family peptidase [Opitutaceae bacterium]
MPRPHALRSPRAAFATTAAAAFAFGFASAARATDAQSHLLSGTLENPVFANSTVGTDLLWQLGYYGQDIVIANVEAGHFWGGHEVFNRAAVNAAVGTSLPPAPAVQVNVLPTAEATALGEIDFHATMVAHVLGGATLVPLDGGGFALSALGSGIAPLATLWSGAIATTYSSDPDNIGAFEITEESFRLPYVEFFTGATHGRADVINSSWGGAGTSQTSEARTITGLAAQNPSVTAVFSAGNSGPGPDQIGFPASSPNVISVGSLGGASGLTPSSFSSGGPVSFYHPGTDSVIPAARSGVHLAAPGEDFALAAYVQPTGGLAPILTLEDISTADNLYFVFSASGTSFSAPIVSGGVGLLKNLIKANPAFFPQETALDARVIRSVTMASSLRTEGWNNAQLVAPGGELLTTQALDPRTGAGRFDVGRAAELYISGTRDVPGLAGASGLASVGWDFGTLDLG